MAWTPGHGGQSPWGLGVWYFSQAGAVSLIWSLGNWLAQVNQSVVCHCDGVWCSPNTFPMSSLGYCRGFDDSNLTLKIQSGIPVSKYRFQTLQNVNFRFYLPRATTLPRQGVIKILTIESPELQEKGHRKHPESVFLRAHAFHKGHTQSLESTN